MKQVAPARPSLDVRDLEIILALSRSGSTVRAASALHVTQSAVSRGLLLAEEKLGARLFERTPRGLAPTPAGSRLIAGAGSILAQLAELERSAGTAEAAPVRLRVVCECYTAYRWLPSTVAALRRNASTLEVELAVDHTDAPVPALLAGRIDVALLTTSPTPPTLVSQALFSDEIVFVVSSSHPLASRPTLTPAELASYPLITSTQVPDAEARWFASRVFGKRRPKLTFVRLPLTEAIIDAARAGMGVAALSEWVTGPYLYDPGLVAKRLRGRPLERPWRIAYRRDVAAAAEHLAAALEGAPPRVYAR